MWTLAANPLDQLANGACWAEDLAEFLAVGADAAVTEALIRSSDGTSWIYQASPFDGGIGNAAVRDLFHGVTIAAGQSPGEGDAFITSPDNATWTGRGNPFLGAAFGIGAAVRESDGALFVVGASFGFGCASVSVDDGVTWTGLVLPADTFSAVRCAAVRAADDLLLIGGNPLDLYYFPASDYAAVSSDGGATWLTTRPFGDGGLVAGCAVRDSDGALVVAGIDGSGYAKVGVSTDDGATWTTYAPFGVLASSELAGVAVRQSDDALIVVGADNGEIHHLAISTDGGTTWTPRVPFDVGGFAQGVSVRSPDDAIIVVGTDNLSSVQFAVSTDSGLTWTTSAVGLIGIGNGVAIRDSDDLILVAGTGDDSVAISTDGGGTWVVSSTFAGGYGAGAAVRQGDGALLVAGSFAGGVIQSGVSTDNGATWTTAAPLSLPVGNALCIACKQSNGALVAGGDYAAVRTIALSSDGGATWTAVPSPFDGGGQVNGIDYSVADDTWFASGIDAAGSTPLVAFSTDDGATWTLLGVQPPMAYNFASLYPRVYRDEPNSAWWVLGQTTGNKAAAVSVDGGASWAEVATPLDDPSMVGGAFAIINTGAALALVGQDSSSTKQMCVSVDAGATWEFDDDPSPFGSGTAVALAYSPTLDVAVAVGNSGAGTVAYGLPSLPLHSVTYDGNGSDGGSVPVDPSSPYIPGTTVTVLDSGDLTKTGYVFSEWNTAADGSGDAYGPGDTFVMPSADVTLYAQWVPPPPPAIGSFRVATANEGDDTVSILQVDPDATTTVIDTVAAGSGPTGIDASPNGSMLAVANVNDGTVSIIQTFGDVLLAVVPVGIYPKYVAWSPDGALVAVSNFTDDTVSIIEIASLSVIQTVSVFDGPASIRFAPDGSYVALVCQTSEVVQVVETTGWTVSATSDVFDAPLGLDIASDGSYIAVALHNDNTVVALDPVTLAVTQTALVGVSPSGVSIDPALAFVAATNLDDGTVSVIETTGWTVTNTVTVGTNPQSIDTAPDSSFVAVANTDDYTVSIIRTSNWTVATTTSVGAAPLSLVVYTAIAPPAEQPTPKALKNTWRWVVCGLDGVTKSFLDKLATNVQIEYVLDDAARMTCDLPSDNPEVHQLTNPDHLGRRYPRVNFGNRVLYGLRREEPGNGNPPWVCRFAGVISILQDQANEDEPVTHLTADDPWTWARSLPVFDIDGSVLGPGGLTYTGKTGDYIAKDLIANAYAWIVATFPDPMPWSEQGDIVTLPNDGEHNFIDIQTGHFDTTEVIPTINFAQGTSVGDAWAQLCQTGTVDIILKPVFGRRGVLCVMNVYGQAGKERPSAVFGWDLFPRNLVGVDHLIDGTLIENWAQFFAGNAAAPFAASNADGSGSIGTYGPYYVSKSYPAGSNPASVSLLALAEVALRKKGKQTLVVDPTPGLAPDPFTQYFLGDVVPIWAGRPMTPSGNALRGGIRSANLGANRVYGFELDLADDLQETVRNLLLTDPNATV